MSARDKKIIVVLVGFVLLALSYFFVFRPSQEQKDTLETENSRLKAKYDELSQLALKSDEYKSEIETMNMEIDEILAEYPSHLQVENAIMDVVNMEYETKSPVTSLTVGAPIAIDISGNDNSQTTDETAAPTEPTEDTSSSSNYQLYAMENSAVFSAGNEGLKKLVNFIGKSANKQKIVSLSASFNQAEGKLDGTVIYDSYFLYGIEKPYEAPYIPSVTRGTNNVFGTYEGTISTGEGTEETEDTEDTENN